jgi:hypothetical protein
MNSFTYFGNHIIICYFGGRLVKTPRRPMFRASPYTSNVLSFASPWITFWWSAAFPGFGHVLARSNVWGFILMSSEYTLNTISHLNQAIFLSMIGEFEAAKTILDLRYFQLYVVIYVYTMWDSYRRTIDNNKMYQLAYQEIHSTSTFRMSALEINVMGKKIPWIGLAWSFLLPGTGYIYLQRIPMALFTLVWWGIILHHSRILEGVFYTAIGDFPTATASLDPQWLLYTPSIWGFAMYDTYSKIVENNRLFEIEQARFLSEEYQKGDLDELFQVHSQPCT